MQLSICLVNWTSTFVQPGQLLIGNWFFLNKFIYLLAFHYMLQHEIYFYSLWQHNYAQHMIVAIISFINLLSFTAYFHNCDEIVYIYIYIIKCLLCQSAKNQSSTTQYRNGLFYLNIYIAKYEFFKASNASQQIYIQIANIQQVCPRILLTNVTE